MAALHPAAPPLSTLATLRTFPPAAWILFVGVFLNKFGTFVLPFLSIYLTRQGFSTVHAGFAVAAYGFGALLASLSGGHLADTLGRRKTIVLSMVSVAVAMVLLSQARSFPVIVALTALAGWTGELYRPASSALLADLIPPEGRVTAFSAYRMAFNAGWAFGPATAGFLASKGFFWLFIGDAITSLLFGVVAWFLLPRGVRSATREATWAQAVRVMWNDRLFHQVLLAALLIGLVFQQMATTYGLYVTSMGFSDATYGMLLSLNGVLVVLCELPLTGFTRRYPPRPTMAVGYLLLGAGFTLNAVASGVPSLALCMTIFTLGEMATIPVASAYLANLAPVEFRGRYMGVWGFAGALTVMIGPNLGLWLFRLEPKFVWMACGVFGLLAALTVLVPVKSATTPQRSS